MKTHILFMRGGPEKVAGEMKGSNLYLTKRGGDGIISGFTDPSLCRRRDEVCWARISFSLSNCLPEISHSVREGERGPSISETPIINYLNLTECALSGRNSEYVCRTTETTMAVWLICIMSPYRCYCYNCL